jgi:putative addiction module killer protein
MLPLKKYHIEEYLSKTGDSYFRIWLNGIRDIKTKARIQARLLRVEMGNLGDCKFLGDGVMELRFDFSSGYIIYFGTYKSKIIILLLAGDKSTQVKDIAKAKRFWKEYLEEKQYDKKD